MTEITGESVNGFIEGQKVLLDLAQEQNEIVLSGVKDRLGSSPAAHAVADLFGRGMDGRMGIFLDRALRNGEERGVPTLVSVPT